MQRRRRQQLACRGRLGCNADMGQRASRYRPLRCWAGAHRTSLCLCCHGSARERHGSRLIQREPSAQQDCVSRLATRWHPLNGPTTARTPSQRRLMSPVPKSMFAGFILCQPYLVRLVAPCLSLADSGSDWLLRLYARPVTLLQIIRSIDRRCFSPSLMLAGPQLWANNVPMAGVLFCLLTVGAVRSKRWKSWGSQADLSCRDMQTAE